MWLVPRGPCITGLYIDIARIKSTLQSLPDCLDDFMSFVSHPDEAGAAFAVVVDRDRCDAHFAQGVDDTTGDLTAIGDQNLGKRG